MHNNPAHSLATPESRWPHRLAVLLACATFPMVFVGAMVTTKKAGMAVPDWPTTFGYNPFLYPLSTWLAAPWNLFIEHGHRLLGWVAVGPLTIALVAALWFTDSRAWVRAFGLFALALVIAQGVLGGMRVRLDELELAKIHGCVGPLFLATAVALSAFCSPLWRSTAEAQVAPDAGKLHRLALLTTVLAYLQLVAGAQLRHVAPDASATAFQLAVFFHLALAAAVTVHAGLLLLRVSRQFRNLPRIFRTTVELFVLVLVQLVLGGATWVLKYGWPGRFLADQPLVAGWTNAAGTLGQSMLVTAHVALGSLILSASLMVALLSLRLVRRPQVVPGIAAGMTPGDSPGAKTVSGQRFVGVAL